MFICSLLFLSQYLPFPFPLSVSLFLHILINVLEPQLTFNMNK